MCLCNPVFFGANSVCILCSSHKELLEIWLNILSSSRFPDYLAILGLYITIIFGVSWFFHTDLPDTYFILPFFRKLASPLFWWVTATHSATRRMDLLDFTKNGSIAAKKLTFKLFVEIFDRTELQNH